MKKSLLLLFVFSFVCVIFTINNLCFKYVDTNVNRLFLSYTPKTLEYLVDDNQSEIDIKGAEKNNLVISLGVGCTFFFLFVYAADIASLIIFVLFLCIYLIAYKLCLDRYFIISLFSTILAVINAKVFAVAYIDNFKENVRQKIENVLGKYISKDISDRILKNDEVQLGGKKAQISVMFADIRGFTSLSETRKAEDVSALLNEYFTELEPIIAKHDGVINKFIGDAMLVVFGDPKPDNNHALKAVKCAHELREKVKEIKERWICEGKPKIDIGIGINSGEAFIGNIGSANRFEYTVIGDTVNIASRIEDYNKICKTHILISDSTYNRISQIVDVIKIREVSIKGKKNKIDIYEVLRIIE